MNEHEETLTIEVVVERIDRMIETTIASLVERTQTPEQLVLNTCREEALRKLQRVLHDQVGFAQLHQEQVWLTVNAIADMVSTCILDDV